MVKSKGAHIFLSVWILSVAAAICAAGQAPAADSAAVQVSINANNWRVQVLKPSHLRAVLQSVCEQSQTVCDIAPDLNNNDEMVVPMTVHGTAPKVISELLEGTKVNYSYVPPDSQGKGKLILANALLGPLGVPNRAGQQPPQPEVQPAAAYDMNRSLAAPTAASTMDTGYSSEAESSEIAPGTQALPFLGADGHLHVAPMNHEAGAFLPVLDAKGNLVPYTRPSDGPPSVVSPSLGPDGKLLTVPVGSGKSEFIPALDSHGNLLPAPR